MLPLVALRRRCASAPWRSPSRPRRARVPAVGAAGGRHPGRAPRCRRPGVACRRPVACQRRPDDPARDRHHVGPLEQRPRRLVTGDATLAWTATASRRVAGDRCAPATGSWRIAASDTAAGDRLGELECGRLPARRPERRSATRSRRPSDALQAGHRVRRQRRGSSAAWFQRDGSTMTCGFAHVKLLVRKAVGEYSRPSR